ncbi:hypothetical protein V9T40_005063 [Parthenolecanium corni]|uniref:UDP-glucose 4-epimerase n=1 Tax=Parthenolecanium corni TaxID=536013 RepID=A0AAN9Y3P1_9HEMI
MRPQWKTIFVSGGAGYIGSHCIVELLQQDFEVIAVDNFINSVDENGDAISLKRVRQITGKDVKFYQCDLLDTEKLDYIFSQHSIDCVIHFAAMKAVGESMKVPLLYYQNNLIGAINLLKVMKKYKCQQLIFSSSCTVYGNPKFLPITEDHPVGDEITNVYGKTKHFIEEMLKDVSTAEEEWNIICLRYFNPVGAHPSGLIGEDPTKPFTNLMPFISQVASGKKNVLTIFGGDYETVDGTGVRDYIHIMDLASGHIAALRKLEAEHLKWKVYNLGTGRGISVLELVKAFEEASEKKIPYTIEARREGDIYAMYANTDLARKELNWKAQYTLKQMCEDFWRWQTMNPNGYKPNDQTSSNSSSATASQQNNHKTNGH